MEPRYTLRAIKTRSLSWPSTCAVCSKPLKTGQERGVLEFWKDLANGTAYKTVMVCVEHLPKKGRVVVAA